MTEAHCTLVASELGIAEGQVRAVEALLAEGATIPFIARYRKERTGSLDEVALTRARDRLAQLAALDKRREVILNSLQEREFLTDELRSAIEAAQTMAVLEDIYLPYRPKRRTRATVAREKGLEPLAQKIFTQEDTINPLREATPFLNAELGVVSTDDALAGARDIIAEWMNEDAETRQAMRQRFARYGALQSKAAKDKEEEGAKYRDYFDWRDPVPKAHFGAVIDCWLMFLYPEEACQGNPTWNRKIA